MPTYNTPDVYIQEVSLLPPSVAEVATAIPAFIGYTEKADRKGIDLLDKPLRITSLLEYQQHFGGSPDPKHMQARVTLEADGSFKAAELKRPYYLHDSVRLFFDNGGGPCWIISVGKYDANSRTIAKERLLSGLEAVRKEDEPTLLVIPEATLLAKDSDRAEVHQKMLAQCETLQDRFAILDVHWIKGERDEQVRTFRGGLGMQGLRYGAAYYPYVQTSYGVALSYAHLTFVQVTADPEKPDELGNRLGDAKGVDPEDRTDAAKLAVQRLDKALADQKKLRDALNSAGGTGAELSFPQWFARLQGNTRGTKGELEHYAAVIASVAALLKRLAGSLENDGLREVAVNLTRTDGPFGAALTTLKRMASGWKGAVAGADTELSVTLDASLGLAADADKDIKPDERAQYYGPATGGHAEGIKKGGEAFKRLFDAVYEMLVGLENSAKRTVEIQEDAARAQHPVLRHAFDELERAAAIMPPSGAIAGLYAYVDNSRGVWKAPANVSLSSVVGPVELLDTRDQETLNVDVDAGKSINALRAFAGKGTLVWGARTLAGNDNEWRYVPVRRFFNTVEESVKKATAWAVFEPNDANTWVRVKSMIENYLTQKWRDGALVGARPVDAFFVKVGLGSTMTPVDILEGRMFVEIGMAVVRPAEFIILRFSHKLQTA